MVYSFKNILWEVALSWRKSCKMHSWGPCFLTASCLKQRKNIYKLRTENSGTQNNISLVFRVACVPELLTFQLFLEVPCWGAASHPCVMHRALLICPVTCESKIQLQSPGWQQKLPQPLNLGPVVMTWLRVRPGRGLCLSWWLQPGASGLYMSHLWWEALCCLFFFSSSSLCGLGGKGRETIIYFWVYA